jgi:hypothetical protein
MARHFKNNINDIVSKAVPLIHAGAKGERYYIPVKGHQVPIEWEAG